MTAERFVVQSIDADDDDSLYGDDDPALPHVLEDASVGHDAWIYLTVGVGCVPDHAFQAEQQGVPHGDH